MDTNKILATSGAVGDRMNFADYIARNLVLNATRQGRPNSASSAGLPDPRRGPTRRTVLLASLDIALAITCMPWGISQ